MASLVTVMTEITPQGVLDVLLAPFTVLATGLSCTSGAFAVGGLARGVGREELSRLVDTGVAVGFLIFLPLAVYTFGLGLFSAHA